MTEDQIKPIIQSYLEQSISRLDKENPKLDFKSKWYDLKDDLGGNEFLKDTSSIANTPGLDGYIIIGFDDKTKLFNSSTFKDSGLKDSNELVGYINKRVDRAFKINCFDIELEGNKLSILHIPPSFDKPHVIRAYKTAKKEEHHRVFIRNGTSSMIANKYDLDFIAYDRKNQIAEYSLHISSSLLGYHTNWSAVDNKVNLGLNLTIENNGLRPVAINTIELKLVYADQSFKFISDINKEPSHQFIKVANFIISPGTINNYPSLVFKSQDIFDKMGYDFFENQYRKFTSIEGLVRLNTGKIIELKVEVF